MGLSKSYSLDKKEKTFLIFIAVSLGCNVLAYITSYLGNNVYVVYLFTVCEALILPIFLLEAPERKKYRIAWISTVLVIIGVVVFEAIAREGGIQKWNNLSLTLVALTAGIMSIRKLLKLRFDERIFDLAKSSVFWFTLGLGVYYLGNLLIYSFLRVFQNEAPELLSNLTYFRLSVVYISVILYIVGFAQIKSNAKLAT